MVTLFTNRFCQKCCTLKHLPLSFQVSNYKIHACYNLLGVAENSDLDEVREAYLRLAKKYHPDTGSKGADANMFARIEEAYKTIVVCVSFFQYVFFLVSFTCLVYNCL